MENIERSDPPAGAGVVPLATHKFIQSRATALAVALLSVVPSAGLAQINFYGVGDLPGGITQSEVRDTTRVGTTLYAVGQSAANGSTGNDTQFLWTSTGGMTALPPLAPGVVGTSALVGGAITPNGAYIAGRARFNGAQPSLQRAVRVTAAGLANLDLGTLTGFPQFSAATAIASDGSVLYGVGLHDLTPHVQAARFTAAGPTATAIPFLNVGDDTSIPCTSTSTDGSVTVGTSANSAITGGKFYGPGNAAYRYVEGSGVSAIPMLPGGTWNQGVAISPDGTVALVGGDSPTAPFGEPYLYNFVSAAATPLGTPAAGWRFNGGGMNSDGSIVAGSMIDPENPAGASFVRNASGWHDLQAIVSGAGIDLTGWTLDVINGISQDGTRIWGSGVHNGSREGFIVEFPAGYLAAYAASPPAQSIVGAYTDSDTTKEGAGFVAFLANGTYFDVEDALAADAPAGIDGFERGTYTWDPVTKAFTVTTIVDTNGDYGLSCCSGAPGMTVSILGKYLTANLSGGSFSVPLVTGSSPIVGAWVVGDSTLADSSGIAAFFANGTHLQAYDGPATAGQVKGMERGTYTWNPVTGAFTATTLVDTNGTAGFSNPAGPVTVTVSGDTATYSDGVNLFTAHRVVAVPLAPSMAVGMSHRVHGGSGPFDLVTNAVTTNPTTEPRTGPNHTMIFTFDKPVIAGAATVTEGTAVAGTPTFNANMMTVPLTGVTDRQYVTVTVSNVASADGGTGGSGVMRVGYLVGDVNQTRVVSVGDLGLVNAQLAQTVTAANYLRDVNASGTLTVADKGITNANLTKSLPPP
jgi:hypothetical protein